MKTGILYRSPLLDRQLARLLSSGKAAAAAAQRAMQIIEEIGERGQSALEVTHRLTRHGELRLEKCLKYDLSGGYRLISITRGRDIFFLYAGSHDACDRWLNNRRGNSLSIDTDAMIKAGHHSPQEKSPTEELPSEPVDDYDSKLEGLLDDRTLRNVFRGICNGR